MKTAFGVALLLLALYAVVYAVIENVEVAPLPGYDGFKVTISK